MRKLNSIVRPTLPLIALFLGGCGLPSIEGQWVNASILDGQAEVTYHFRPDGTFTNTAKVNVPGSDLHLSAIGHGTYTLKKDHLVTDVTGFSVEGVPDSLSREVQRNIPRFGRRSISGSMQWKSADSFVLIEDLRGTTMIFRRVKK